jgi:hypothetical protein
VTGTDYTVDVNDDQSMASWYIGRFSVSVTPDNGKGWEITTSVVVETYCICVGNKEKFEDNKWVIRSCKSMKDRQYNDKRKRTRGQAMIHKTPHRKLKIVQHNAH